MISGGGNGGMRSNNVRRVVHWSPRRTPAAVDHLFDTARANGRAPVAAALGLDAAVAILLL